MKAGLPDLEIRSFLKKKKKEKKGLKGFKIEIGDKVIIMAVNIKITKWFDITPHWRLAKLFISILTEI